MKNKKTIALTWGYTWGHVFPLLSVYNYLKNTWKYDFVWVWEEWNIEEEVAQKYKIAFYDISAWKIRRYFDYRNLYEPLKNLTWIIEWIYYIFKKDVDIVFSKWWYVSIPLSIAAWLTRKKIYIHESDTISGISNKIVWKLATKVFYSFPNEKIDWKKHIKTGQIINPELTKLIDLPYPRENKRLCVLVMWGIQWSTRIFDAMLKVVWDLSDINFQIILWKKNQHFREKFKNFQNLKIHDFVEQQTMWKILKESDIAITRWWATSLWELYYFGVHSIIIPLKGSASNHQEYNAKYFSEKFWSEVINEDFNVEKELLVKLQKYKDLRKVWMNLKEIETPLEKLKFEIEKKD